MVGPTLPALSSQVSTSSPSVHTIWSHLDVEAAVLLTPNYHPPTAQTGSFLLQGHSKDSLPLTLRHFNDEGDGDQGAGWGWIYI